MLILAAVSIATLTGQNGILTQANNAKTETTIGEEKEEIAIAYNGAMAENKGMSVTADDINIQFGINGTRAEASGTSPITIKFEETQRVYTMYYRKY